MVCRPCRGSEKKRRLDVGRWPDKSRSALTTFVLIFVLFPLLCLLAWWFVEH